MEHLDLKLLHADMCSSTTRFYFKELTTSVIYSITLKNFIPMLLKYDCVDGIISGGLP
jgi:hypothetical protein